MEVRTMVTLKNILAATDLSNSSIHAVERGFLIAKETGSNFIVAHALDLDALSSLRSLLGENITALEQKVLDDAREQLLELVSDPQRNQGVTASLQLERGLATTAIPEKAEAIGADLILVGAHGSGFLQRILLGSTASRLLRKSKCPVLVVKQAPHDTYKRVLVAVDFSPSSENAIRMVREVAPAADILLLNIFEVPFEGKMQYAGVKEEIIHQYRIEAREHALHQLHDLAKSAGLAQGDYTGSVVYGDTTRQIIEHEEKYNCDLIVMGKHGIHVTEELLLGSVTKRLLAESQSDVLVVIDPRGPGIVEITP
jgi:CPA2 family monovalent cation:H+ antiporter-2